MQKSETLSAAGAWLGLRVERAVSHTILRTKRQVSAKAWRFCLLPICQPITRIKKKED